MAVPIVKIQADVTISTSDVRVSNVEIMDNLPPKFNSFFITPERNAAGGGHSDMDRILNNLQDAQRAAVRSSNNNPLEPHYQPAYYATQQRLVAADVENTNNMSDIIFGEYFLIYGSLYMKKNFIAYIQFINNRWFFYFQYAGVFYSFYTDNETNRYMDLSVLQNNFFTRNNLHRFNNQDNIFESIARERGPDIQVRCVVRPR